MLFTSRTSTDLTQRSSVTPVGTSPIEPHLSGATAGTEISGDLTMRSGSPSVQPSAPLVTGLVGGISAGLPRGAPLSAHFATFAISSSLSEISPLYFWMPMFFSTNHGGMTPACGPTEVRVFIARAHGRTSSYEISDIGAPPSGLWHC